MYDRVNRDTDAFLMAKHALFPDEEICDLTTTQLSELLQRAEKIKRAAKGDE